jgi:phospholipase/carboxylesterase
MTEREETIELGGLPAIAVGDRDAAKVVMVLAHGFQMAPEDLSPFAHSIRAPAYFLFPQAPRAAEDRGRAWWYIDARLRDEAIKRGPRDFCTVHPPDLPDARARLYAFWRAAKAIAGERPFVVGGFSQGGMLTADTYLRSEIAVSAMVLLSASRIAFDEWQPLLPSGRFADLPVLVSHGQADPDLAFSAGEALRDALTAAGARVDWLPFEQAHEIPLVVWRRLRMLLLQLSAPTRAT